MLNVYVCFFEWLVNISKSDVEKPVQDDRRTLQLYHLVGYVSGYHLASEQLETAPMTFSFSSWPSITNNQNLDNTVSFRFIRWLSCSAAQVPRFPFLSKSLIFMGHYIITLSVGLKSILDAESSVESFTNFTESFRILLNSFQ